MRIVAKLEEWAANSLMSKAARIGLLWSSDAEYKCHTCIYVGTLLKYSLPQMYFVFALSTEILHWSMYIGAIMDERWTIWVNAFWSNTLINFNICDFDIQKTRLIWKIFSISSWNEAYTMLKSFQVYNSQQSFSGFLTFRYHGNILQCKTQYSNT